MAGVHATTVLGRERVSERSRTRKTRTFGLKKTTGARIIIFFSSVRCPRSSSLLWPYATALCILIRVSAILYSYMAVVPSACVFRRSRRPLSRVRPVRIRRLAVLWTYVYIYRRTRRVIVNTRRASREQRAFYAFQ